MSRWIWVIVAISISTAVYFTIRYGLRPKPIPVLNPTHFENAEQIGTSIYKLLRQNVRADHLVLLGSSPGMEEDALIWDGFAKAAAVDRESVETIVLKDVTDRAVMLSQIREWIKAKKLVLVRGLTPEVSHLVKESWSKYFDRELKHPVLSISTMRLAINPEEYDDVQTQCLDPDDDTGLRKLDCAAQKVARKYLKRNLAPEKLWAVMERHGLKEYLLFIHRP